MNSFVRINALVNRSPAGNPLKCGDNMIRLMDRANMADITIFPTLSLMPPSSGSLFSHKDLIDKCKRSFSAILERSRDKEGYIIFGLPIYDCGKCVSAIAVMHKGEILGLLPDFSKHENLEESFSSHFLSFNSIFQCGDLRFAVSSCNYENMLTTAAGISKSGCNLMVFTSYSHHSAGQYQKIFDTARIISQQYDVAVLLINGGVGDTSSPFVYEGMVCLFENGQNIVLESSSDEEIAVTFDIDPEIVKGSNTNGDSEAVYYIEPIRKNEVLKEIDKIPFVPKMGFMRDVYLDELFALQVESISKRLINTKIRHAVIGVSGGLDSTLALMAAVCAFDKAEIPRENLYCITMPGFGTSDRTYYNALGLMETLGVTKEDISIRASVLQHFEDIGHNPDDKNVTYENAQARERTQILMDISNEINGFVIGTGDLSESALGWCTFGGDSIAGFNVNICIPKTVVRLLVERLAETKKIEGTENYLFDVLSTPVSPELLPSDEMGEIAQKTEEIIGSYDLHDFFLYYLLKYGFSPEKLFLYAAKAFEGDVSEKEIKERLITFTKRFYRSQFKRTLAPDCADITEVNLSNGNFNVPSDLDIDYLLSEIEEIVVRN